MYTLIQYIKFLLKSTNQHGVHSPFVYNLVTKCFYDTVKHSAYKAISAYKKNLLKNKTVLEIANLDTDLQVNNHKKRKISAIAKHIGLPIKRAKLLYRLVSYFKFESILELDTSLGITTHALSLANPNANITTVDGCPNRTEFIKTNFKNHQLKNIDLRTGKLNKIVTDLSSNSYDLILFNTNFKKETTIHYFETFLETAHNDSVFIFNAIYCCDAMKEAWETIRLHPKVTVTVDTFFWGIVFFRNEQAKEHFVIRL